MAGIADQLAVFGPDVHRPAPPALHHAVGSELGDNELEIIEAVPGEAEVSCLPYRVNKMVKGSTLHHLKELRPGSARSSEIRILFAFDPASNAVLLVAGDKAGHRRRWYAEAIPLVEQRYKEWITEAGP
ncbi:MAG: type II toxin-antitoxin system RelE/ParE family toxin [Pseudonocardiales bacterium]